ncbi:serine/threonine-protein phosphatase 4 regulatory subunit 2 isoform X2 [Procambarus clarkii]|nr:serine/threonine-protein phosphatase 4 regulatory subunit 2-like isoform X2 [Procambarus clarkii]
MRYMLETVMNEFYENCGGEDISECGNVPAFSYTTTRDKLLHHFDSFSGAPFTIQRLCEIMVDPTRHYKRTDKFLRGLEKNVLVVSNIEPGRQRRSEDSQQTLVNGLQDGGLHTSPLSVSSATSPMSHHPKRLSITQSANSITNNASESYSREIGDSENQVTGSEANGPSGLHRDEITNDSLKETAEPPSKKVKTESRIEEKATGSAEDLSQIEEKSDSFNTSSDAESMEAEASEDDSESSSSSSSNSNSAKTESMDSREAEATCHSVRSNAKETKVSLDRLGQQVGTSELITEDSAHLTEEDRDKDEVEDDTSLSLSPEVCSSNSSHRGGEQKLEEENDTVGLLSTSAPTINAEESPDSVEGTLELVHQQEEQTKAPQDEREGTSEAAAAAENSSRNESEHIIETPSVQEDNSNDSHEADSTSQAQSNGALNQPAPSVVGTPSSPISSPSPSTDPSSATVPDPSVAPSISSPSDSVAHTTSQSLPSASSPPAVSASTSSPLHESSDPTIDTGATASTSSSSPPHSDSTVGQEPDNTSSGSSIVELNNKVEKDNGNVSCSSSQPEESEEKDQLMK